MKSEWNNRRAKARQQELVPYGQVAAEFLSGDKCREIGKPSTKMRDRKDVVADGQSFRLFTNTVLQKPKFSKCFEDFAAEDGHESRVLGHE